MLQLCHLADDWRGIVPPSGMYAECKVDGWRALYFRGVDGKPRLWTRGGHPIEGVEHILYRLALFERVAGIPLFIDGEFQVGGTLADTKAWCESGWKAGGEAGRFYAFDCLPEHVWRSGGGDAPQMERKALLEALAGAVEHDPALSWEWRPGSHGKDEGVTPVYALPSRLCSSPADVLALAGDIWVAGGEGVMLKDPDAPYRRIRSSAWQKVKQCNAVKWLKAA